MATEKDQKRILLVGSGGRIGRMISYNWTQMLPSGQSFIRQGRVQDWPTDSSSLQWDPANGVAALCTWVDRFGPIDVMFILSGVVPAPGCDLSLNTTIAQTCLDGAKAAGIRRVLLSSSSAVYGAYKNLPYKETDYTKPVNAYGEAKLTMEALGRSYVTDDFEVSALRIGNVAGADALLLNRAKATADRPLLIDRFQDGSGPSRSYIGPKTLARVCQTLTTTLSRLPAVINVAAPEPLKMEELAIAANIPWTYKPAPSTAHQNITLDCGNLTLLHEFEKKASSAGTQIAELIEMSC